MFSSRKNERPLVSLIISYLSVACVQIERIVPQGMQCVTPSIDACLVIPQKTNQRAVKQTVKYSTSVPTCIPPAGKRGSGGEHCGGTTQLSSPNAASRGEVFCKSFRRKAGRFAKILRRTFTTATRIPPKNLTLPVASVVALRL